MMDKIASDAYSQGAYEALQQMNVPGHIKQAAAQYLTKESGAFRDAVVAGRGRIADAFRSVGGIRKKPVGERAEQMFLAGQDQIARGPFKDQIANLRLQDLGIAGTTLGLGGAGIYGANELLSDDEGLSQAQMAALGLGGAALLGGGAYAANQAGLI